MINRLKALVVRAAAWAWVPVRQRDDREGRARGRVSRVDLDEVMLLAQDLRSLLAIVARSAEAMYLHAGKALPVDTDFRDLDAACERAHRVIQRLTSIDRISPLARYPIDVNLAIVECTEMLERAVGEQVRVVLDLAPTVGHVLAERLEIERLLLNLAMSGRHAMPDRGVLTIHTASLREVPPGLKLPHVKTRPYVRLTVSDTGTGMPSGARMRVLGRTPLRKQHGAELGLAAVAHTVRSLDGSLSVEGDDGQGTRVIIDLPCVEIDVPLLAGV